MGKKIIKSKVSPRNNECIKVNKLNKTETENALNHRIVWQLSLLDLTHPQWGWKNLKHPTTAEVLTKLQNYETMTWNEIASNSKRDHFVSKDQLEKAAKSRLSELGLDDLDSLYRLRLTGKQRVWGVRQGYVFKILWVGSRTYSVPFSIKRKLIP